LRGAAGWGGAEYGEGVRAKRIDFSFDFNWGEEDREGGGQEDGRRRMRRRGRRRRRGGLWREIGGGDGESKSKLKLKQHH
jgi:hypothetical protein